MLGSNNPYAYMISQKWLAIYSYSPIYDYSEHQSIKIRKYITYSISYNLNFCKKKLPNMFLKADMEISKCKQRQTKHQNTNFQKWQFLYRKVQDIYQKFPGHSKTYHSKSLIVNKNFQDIYIFLKFLSKTLLSCPTLISEIEE